MVIDRSLFENVLTQLAAAQSALVVLGNAIDTADAENTFDPVFIDISSDLSSIQPWAQGFIDQANQEEAEFAVMTNFLAELKVVFDKYTASSAITPFETGYGTSYGEPGLGYVLTASFEGVSSSKEIKKSVINGSDLV